MAVNITVEMAADIVIALPEGYVKNMAYDYFEALLNPNDILSDEATEWHFMFSQMCGLKETALQGIDDSDEIPF